VCRQFVYRDNLKTPFIVEEISNKLIWNLACEMNARNVNPNVIHDQLYKESDFTNPH
jgi:hypothetical protein